MMWKFFKYLKKMLFFNEKKAIEKYLKCGNVFRAGDNSIRALRFTLQQVARLGIKWNEVKSIWYINMYLYSKESVTKITDQLEHNRLPTEFVANEFDINIEYLELIAVKVNDGQLCLYLSYSPSDISQPLPHIIWYKFFDTFPFAFPADSLKYEN